MRVDSQSIEQMNWNSTERERERGRQMTQLTQAIRNGKTDRIYGEKVKENTREAK